MIYNTFVSMNTYNLQRFLDAQDSYDSYQSALEELRQGQKRSHWIWFILQITTPYK